MNSVFNMLMMAGGGGHPVPPGPMISGTRSETWSPIGFTVTEHDNTTHNVYIDSSYGLSWEWDNPSGWNIKKIQFTNVGWGVNSIVLSGDWRTVTDMSGMFYNQSINGSITINSIDTSSVTNMSSMFKDSLISGALDLSTLKVNRVTDMSEMFSGAQNLASINISGWNTANVTDMSGMFENCYNVTTITGIENINVSNVTDMSRMFYYCQHIIQNESHHLDLSEWRPVSAVSLREMFYRCDLLYEVNLFNNDDEYINVNDIDHIFESCYALTAVDICGITCEECSKFLYCFSSCYDLEDLALQNMQTSQVVSDPNNWTAFLANVNMCSIQYRASLWNPQMVSAFPNNNWIDID